MKSRQVRRALGLVVLFVLAGGWEARATIPPRPGTKWPKSYEARRSTRADTPPFTYKRALLNVTKRIQQNRSRMSRGELTPA
ncbi:MAG TPA: hypothetical protein VFQ51_20545, partial [Vicinamibacteria bacterium]|nr:hypothetical protein [Vicinamibacteria bacterium]